MWKDFYHIFYYTSLFITAAIALFFLFKEAETAFKKICVLIIITMISELTAYYISHNQHQPNNIVYHFFTLVEYLLYVSVYSSFFDSKRWNKILIVSVALMILLEVFNSIYFQPLNIANTNVMIIENILLVFLSLMLFTHLRTTYIANNIMTEGVFWFNSIVLLYYAFNIMLWGFHNLKIYEMKNPPMITYNINYIFSGLMYISFIFSVWLNIKYRPKTFSTV